MWAKLGTPLLQDAGVSLQAERSTTTLTEAMQFPLQEPLKLPPSPRHFQGRSVVAGMMWLPSREIRLSTAGAPLRGRLLSARRQNLPSLEGEVERVVLDAVWGVLVHRLQNAGFFERMVLSHAADDLISAASHSDGRRRREISSWPGLVDAQLKF